jgi:hypothetical protein
MVQHQERIANYPGADLPALAALHVAHVNEVKDPLAYPLDHETLATLGFIGIENWMDEAATVNA